MDCIFCKIASGNTDTSIVYQDEYVVVFNDLYPKAQVHLLIVPKIHIQSLLTTDSSHENILGRMLTLTNKLAHMHNLQNGFKININTGQNGGQEIMHLHIHMLGYKQL